ncbi:Hydrolase, HAD subfamily IIIA [Marinilactibacillus psychrotolerans 42ea]|uniref:Hydrolase, HAD subfamily IIIA n=1 Tax=Marinilactibacillus psychrotolerans 42ea TaxID=1255609 RepID=A0A1R4IPA8_9LACT|nr:YqeG family HAD IIIA-type phosphatase [Marinilactibacillus psychrotolerans]SJN21588.1 Hydrolase, HAD subfamily IIIA [Marinilactibacillus psychrotolerans 42ea]
MLNSFKPTWMVNSIYQITPEQLKRKNIKTVLTDLDNTLIAWNNPEATEETLEWIERMKASGINVVIISNNKAKRVSKVATILELEFIPNAMKPFQKGFKQAQEKFNLSKDELLMVGDQIITDIKGANHAGIRSVLVKPILNSDAWNTRFNRMIELKIMNYLIKKNPDMKWRDSLHEPVET